MGKVAIREESSTPSTPSEGVVMYPTVATPSILKVLDDAGAAYTFSLLEKAQSFTTTQTIAPASTGAVGISVNMPASTTVDALEVKYNGTVRARIVADATQGVFVLSDFSNGTGIGPRIFLGRNNSGTPGAGQILFYDKNGTFNSVWADGAGNLRIWAANQTANATDLSGTVVGTQTSWHELKEDIQRRIGTGDMLDAVLNLNLYDYQLKEDSYQNHDGGKPSYTGLMITEEDRQSDAWFASGLGEGQIPALNERNLFGYLVGAIQEHQTMIEELRQEILALKGGSVWQR